MKKQDQNSSFSELKEKTQNTVKCMAGVFSDEEIHPGGGCSDEILAAAQSVYSTLQKTDRMLAGTDHLAEPAPQSLFQQLRYSVKQHTGDLRNQLDLSSREPTDYDEPMGNITDLLRELIGCCHGAIIGFGRLQVRAQAAGDEKLAELAFSSMREWQVHRNNVARLLLGNCRSADSVDAVVEDGIRDVLRTDE